VISGIGGAAAAPPRARDDEAAPPAALSEQALWRDLTAANDASVFGVAWLSLARRMIVGGGAGLLMLDRGAGAGLVPVATTSADDAGGPALRATAELAAAERRGVVQPPPAGATQQPMCLAYPLLVDGHVMATAAIEVEYTRDARMPMRQLQWAIAWVRDFLHRDATVAGQRVTDRMAVALDLLAAVLEEEGFQAACRMAATELATRLDCARVSFGFLWRGQSAIEAISHSAQFGKHMNLVRLLADAMDEAIDQHAVVLFPAPEADPAVLTGAHAALAEGHGAGHILTIPLFVKDRFVGAATFERDARLPFDQATLDMAEAVVSILGAALVDKRANDRWLIVKAADTVASQTRALLGPEHFGRKLAAAAVVFALGFCYFAVGTYRIIADGRVEGSVQRAVVVPFDGYISEAPARAGDVVKQGALLAALDDRDLSLERLRWVTERQQHLYEYDKALSERERADALRFKSELDQAEAEIRLVDEQLARARMTAPFDGLVLSGDLSQSIGATVRRGDVLFEIAPLSDYRVVLLVDESQIADVVVGQAGELVAAALPDMTFPFVVERITPVASAHEGRMVFTVEGRLASASERLRPGMEGVARIDVGDRRLVWIAFRSLLHWLSVVTWKWLP